MTDQTVDCRVMAGPERFDAFSLMKHFRPDEARLNAALNLFVEREDYGFVWLAYRDDVLAGCCTVGYTIATSAGGIVAVVRDLYVIAAARRSGVATALLTSLRDRLGAAAVVELQVVAADPAVTAFLTARGYAAAERSFTLVR